MMKDKTIFLFEELLFPICIVYLGAENNSIQVRKWAQISYLQYVTNVLGSDSTIS